ncbi:MAG TPA: OmpH family outer membrane protein [Candidatus Polarisedimenticolaceae bacterium]|nr:OmpH family outer membrane protein [Candidatus Polarisedimenticolaceae bacterium]
MQRPIGMLATIAALIVLAGLGSSTAAQGSFKFGVFDPQRVSEETAEGKRIQAKLEQLRDKSQQEIASEEGKIAELQQQLNQQSLSLSPEKRTQMEIDIQKRLLQLNSRKDTMTRAFQLEIAGEEAQFNEKLRVVVGQFAQAEGFSVILEVGAVAFASPSVDVTTAVIDRFNTMFPAVNE